MAPCWCTRIFFFGLMHPTGPEWPISAHVACARVCRQLYVLRASHILVQAAVGVGTVIIVYIGVAYTKGGGGTRENPPGSNKNPPARQKETPGIIQRPLATIHKHFRTPAKVVCGGSLHRVKSPETSERCRAVRQHPLWQWSWCLDDGVFISPVGTAFGQVCTHRPTTGKPQGLVPAPRP